MPNPRPNGFCIRYKYSARRSRPSSLSPNNVPYRTCPASTVHPTLPDPTDLVDSTSLCTTLPPPPPLTEPWNPTDGMYTNSERQESKGMTDRQVLCKIHDGAGLPHPPAPLLNALPRPNSLDGAGAGRSARTFRPALEPTIDNGYEEEEDDDAEVVGGDGGSERSPPSPASIAGGTNTFVRQSSRASSSGTPAADQRSPATSVIAADARSVTSTTAVLGERKPTSVSEGAGRMYLLFVGGWAG